MHLSEFQESWESDFEKIANFLSPALTGSSARILHVGSTSIPGSIAKPIIDIDVVVKDITEIKAVQEKIESFFYLFPPLFFLCPTSVFYFFSISTV